MNSSNIFVKFPIIRMIRYSGPRGPRVLPVGELVLWYGMFAPCRRLLGTTGFALGAPCVCSYTIMRRLSNILSFEVLLCCSYLGLLGCLGYWVAWVIRVAWVIGLLELLS